MKISMVTPKAQGKILVKQLVQLGKEKRVPINYMTKTEKALSREINGPKFNLNALREKIMTLSENIMLGIRK